MNAAESLKRAVCTAIDQRAQQLAAGAPYSEVTLTVRFDFKTGYPHLVLLEHVSAVKVSVGAPGAKAG